jgi:hypothetical protein
MKKLGLIIIAALALSACHSPAYNVGWDACESLMKTGRNPNVDAIAKQDGADPNDPMAMPELEQGMNDCLKAHGYPVPEQ